ncbi:DUF4249 domain-containing protein [Hymenobacter cellulosivorans]|uniref:DUF4249 domain-containing protein n=1 Tax=Hymenobacter cellulosivorans TaxID=2932249 RepID=A0ABY4FK20_9BACT|nr:DUF4249 domain-containing protein [Hymenobacter cellulosivorans]UOQ55001.1 DUF4249 domain-containing protein [Hymenobacter cellulosivorans]
MRVLSKCVIILLAGGAVVLPGCIDQIDADLPEPPKKLVLNSILTPDSVFRVQVSRVTSTLDSSSRVLSTAKVYLLQPGRPAELLASEGKGLYSLPSKPASLAPYTLQADLEGYPTAQASDTIPTRVPIDEAWYSFPTGTDRNNELLGTIVVRFTDPAAQTNFYEISCYQENQGLTLDVRGNAALAAEDDKEFEPQSLVFSDRLFNGQAFELRGSFLTHGHTGGGSSGPPTTRDPLLVLRTVSRAYYQYRKSWTRHLYNQGTKGDTYNLNQLLFLGDPSTMYSNVAGGYGVVAGYSQNTQRLRPR